MCNRIRRSTVGRRENHFCDANNLLYRRRPECPRFAGTCSRFSRAPSRSFRPAGWLFAPRQTVRNSNLSASFRTNRDRIYVNVRVFIRFFPSSEPRKLYLITYLIPYTIIRTETAVRFENVRTYRMHLALWLPATIFRSHRDHETNSWPKISRIRRWRRYTRKSLTFIVCPCFGFFNFDFGHFSCALRSNYQSSIMMAWKKNYESSLRNEWEYVINMSMVSIGRTTTDSHRFEKQVRTHEDERRKRDSKSSNEMKAPKKKTSR